MADLTPFFKQCVQIYNESNAAYLAGRPRAAATHLCVQDTFNKECHELYSEIQGLTALVGSVKAGYLLNSTEMKEFEDDEPGADSVLSDDESDDTDLNEGPKTIQVFSEEERDTFDAKSNVMLHKFHKKLGHLESYEQKRYENVWFSKDFEVSNAHSRLKLMKTYLDFAMNKEEYTKVNSTIHEYREGVLSSLSHELKKISSVLADMQNIRLSRKLDEKSNELHALSNADMKEPEDAVVELDDTSSEIPQMSFNEMLQIDSQNAAGLEEYGEVIKNMSQQQLQQLQNESSQLLNSKLSELEKVKNLQKSASDIANLQRELSVHVETQAEQIKLLHDDQENAEMDILKGNKQLKGAKLSSRRSSLIVIYSSILLGFLILFFDAVMI